MRSDRLKDLRNGYHLAVAGIVTHRQRPGTASGVVFATLEDEAGTTNLIIWPKVLETYRQAVLGAKIIVVRGQLQSQDGVINIISRQVQDYSDWLGDLATSSRDFH